MSTPFLSEIKIISFNFPPKGWAFCNGQIMAIQQNQALFSLVGTTYGGNGQTTFALPEPAGKNARFISARVSRWARRAENKATRSSFRKFPRIPTRPREPTRRPLPGALRTICGARIQRIRTAIKPRTLPWREVRLAIMAAASRTTTCRPYLVLNFVIAL